nr:radical SAM protein [Candidatus Sigynarchaeum springense]
MIPEFSARIMRKVFEKSRYSFSRVPELRFSSNFGIYVHVPFCHSKCAFCPFYKEIYSAEEKQKYIHAMLDEIKNTKLEGTAQWMYFGGGTPNTLAIDDLRQILAAFREKVRLTSIGIELLPSILHDDYLAGLQELGFTKVSIGVESLSSMVLKDANRPVIPPERVQGIIEKAREHHLRSNVDMMVGMSGQNERGFARDVDQLASMNPDQVTIYPYMAIRGVPRPEVENDEQFEWIENAAVQLKERGFERHTAWVFSRDSDLYDSSRDELVQDYAGFGPAAFSTFGDWKVVNPDLGRYLFMHAAGERLGFVGKKSVATEDWRVFARILYDLRADFPRSMPGYIKSYIATLKLAGYINKEGLTQKGVRLASYLTKAVVEALPYPLQTRASVDNYDAYLAYPTSFIGARLQDSCEPATNEHSIHTST